MGWTWEEAMKAGCRFWAVKDARQRKKGRGGGVSSGQVQGLKQLE